MLAIPRDAGREVLDILAKGVVLIPCVRGRDLFPSGVIEIRFFSPRGIADKQFPVWIKIVFSSLIGLRKAHAQKSRQDQRKDAKA